MTYEPLDGELVELVDVELLLVNYLNLVLDGDMYVGLVVPADEQILAKLPFVRVARRFGLANHLAGADFPVLDIDVWAATNTAVNAAGAIVRKHLAQMRWYVDAETGAVISFTTEVTGPQRLPEDDPQLVRYGFTVALTVHTPPADADI